MARCLCTQEAYTLATSTFSISMVSPIFGSRIKIPRPTLKTNHQQDCRVTSLGVWVVVILAFITCLTGLFFIIIFKQYRPSLWTWWDSSRIGMRVIPFHIYRKRIHRSLHSRFIFYDCNSHIPSAFYWRSLSPQNLIKEAFSKMILCVWEHIRMNGPHSRRGSFENKPALCRTV